MTVASLESEPWGRHDLPEGELYLERPLPFLVVLRASELDPPERALISAEASRLVMTREGDGEALLTTVLKVLRRHSQRVLLIDVITTEPASCVRIHAKEALDQEMAVFAAALEGLDPIERVATAKKARGAPLIDGKILEALGANVVQIQVPRVWRGGDDHEIHYPLVLRDVRAAFSRALQALCHCYARDFTERALPHPGAFGLKRTSAAVREVDSTLGRVASGFSFLLSCTPTNLQEAWQAFQSSREETVPHFCYRPLEIDPDALKRELYLAPIEKVDDPALEDLFREQRDRLAEELTMLEHRKSREFLLGSLRLYGGVSDDLLELARGLPKMIEGAADDAGDDFVDATEFLRLSLEELRHYVPDERDPITCRISEDVDSLIVDRGVLLIGPNLMLSRGRARALIAHEVGTHIVTYLNAREQPLMQLRIGLMGYEELQEGLAVLAEYLVGGLTAGRMRLLAARVIAVHALVDGADFIEIYRELVERAELGRRLAFSTTVRVWRGGGLTKDAVYLRGIIDLLRHFNEGRSLEPLLVGKIASPHFDLIEELMAREVVKRPRHIPRHFRTEEGAERIERLRQGATLLDLIDRSAS